MKITPWVENYILYGVTTMRQHGRTYDLFKVDIYNISENLDSSTKPHFHKTAFHFFFQILMYVYTERNEIIILVWTYWFHHYRQTSNISRTKSQKLNVARLVLQLSLPNSLQLDVKSRTKMYLEKHWQAMLQLHLSDQQFYCVLIWVLY